VGQQLFNEVVDRLTGPDHQDYLAGPHQRCSQLGEGMKADNAGAAGRTLEKGIGFFGCTIVYGHPVTMVVDVQRQVLAHDSKTDQSYVRLRHRHSRPYSLVRGSSEYATFCARGLGSAAPVPPAKAH
jgi:hypothetical protein